MSQSALNTVNWPSNGISEVPFRVYTDHAQYQREQERLFKGPTWNYLCVTVELARPGDYVATTVGETAVIVVRDAAGAINAFVNRCAHRGNLLCLERSGSVKEFGCIYHGWTYDLGGQLTGVAFLSTVCSARAACRPSSTSRITGCNACALPNSAVWYLARSAMRPRTWRPISARM